MSSFNDEIYIDLTASANAGKLEPQKKMGPLAGRSGSIFVEWCDLPDILYSESTRKFVGLSFAVHRDYRDFVNEFVLMAADDNIRFVRLSVEHPARYRGFGDRDRLEIYWDDADDVLCELASLDNGAWLFNDYSVSSSDLHFPCGYNLMSLTEIKEAHGLI